MKTGFTYCFTKVPETYSVQQEDTGELFYSLLCLDTGSQVSEAIVSQMYSTNLYYTGQVLCSVGNRKCTE